MRWPWRAVAVAAVWRAGRTPGPLPPGSGRRGCAGCRRSSPRFCCPCRSCALPCVPGAPGRRTGPRTPAASAGRTPPRSSRS
uniref:Putative secreted protein n=1 Tax=Ixodes ricinus TaxID=34613 RepID=A0A6B0U709_IXORI